MGVDREAGDDQSETDEGLLLDDKVTLLELE